MTFASFPQYDWQYLSEPQADLANRVVPYTRGKGLGGSSAINFCFYTRGAKDDFDEWARRVGDDFFTWENAEKRFKRLEGYQPSTSELHRKYANWEPKHHGTDGPVRISDSTQWEDQQESALLAGYNQGWKPNADVNNGDPIGIAVCATTGQGARRTTAKTAYLDNAPANLEILANTSVTRILFSGKRAIGVQAGSKEFHATKEVILSAGALDSPKLLMLSGIGPRDELSKHGIHALADLPVGVGLQDHLHVPMIVQVKDGSNQRAIFSDPQAVEKARAQLDQDGTGPLSILYNSAVIGFAKGGESVYESAAFKALPQETQRYIKKPTVPTYEFAGLVPSYPLPGFDPSRTYTAVMAFGMCPQSRGTVTLKSADPNDPPVSDPKFFSHPFDRVTLVDGLRKVYKWLRDPIMSPEVISDLAVPASDSDDDLADYITKYGFSTWHMSCTAMMGKVEDPSAVVTTDFKVKGFEGLRVADLSVTPFLPNAHTVSIGYFIGESAAERICQEYQL